MELTKVTVIERFDLGGKTYAPGPAKVPAEKVEKLLEKKLIASQDATEGSPQSGSTLEAEMLGAIAPHAMESESAVETIGRIVSERDDVRQTVALANQTNIEMSQTNQGLIETNHDLLEQVAQYRLDLSQARAQVQNLQQGVETVATTLPPLAGLERGEGESALDYLTRYAEQFKKVVETSEKEQTDGQVPPQTQTEGEVVAVVTTQTPVTADDLTRLFNSPKAALSLLNAKFDTREKLAAASDKELEALPEVGEGRVKKLREWLAA